MTHSRRGLPSILGAAGTRELIEPQLRCLVADQLGVDAHELGARVSLRDDLAADSLDLLELVLVLEREFAICIPDRLLDGVLSYGDLVDAAVRLLVQRGRDQRTAVEEPPQFWARLLLPESVAGGTLTCAGLLTPYITETLAEDARTAGSGAHLDIALAPGTSDVDIARINARFSHLTARGIRVDVRRSGRDVVVANRAAARKTAVNEEVPCR